MLLCAASSAASALKDPPEWFGMPYYSWGAVEALAILIAIATFFIALTVFRIRRSDHVFRNALTATIVIVVVWEITANWDIYTLSRQAKTACANEGGLHIFKTAEVDGFVGFGSSIEYFSKYGFRYLEAYVTGFRGRKTKITIQNGEPHYKEISEFESRYEYRSIPDIYISDRFVKLSAHVVDRLTEEELGHLTVFKIYPGIVDRMVLNFLPVEWQPWICGRNKPTSRVDVQNADGAGNFTVVDLVKAVLIPRKSKG